MRRHPSSGRLLPQMERMEQGELVVCASMNEFHDYLDRFDYDSHSLPIAHPMADPPEP